MPRQKDRQPAVRLVTTVDKEGQDGVEGRFEECPARWVVVEEPAADETWGRRA